MQLSMPANGATVSSPVHFAADGSGGIDALRVYVDDRSRYTAHSRQLNASIDLPEGRHHVVLVGWDAAGHSFTSSEYIGVASPNAGIAVAAPAGGATYSSPVAFAATAIAPPRRTISALWIYVDNQAAYRGNAATLKTSLSLAPGNHYVVFQAWDNKGAVYKQPVPINVEGKGIQPPPPPVPVQPPLSMPFQNNVTATANWLRTNSVAGDGAILYGSSQINPYFANLAAIGLTHDAASYTTVQRWMQWYISHLNWPDKWGLYGTVYDYDYSNGTETSHVNADSTDSYAGTFLSLAWAYYQTGDPSAQNYIKTLEYQLDTIGGILVQTQQSDGLTWAKPDYQIKYLMDNCEAYRGLRDLALIFQTAFNDATKATYYNAVADQMLNGIQSLWMNGNWAVYKDGVGNLTAPNMGTWYPDASSQVFPVLDGVVSASDARSQQVYTNFNAAWPAWPTLSFNAQDAFPWVLVGEAAQIMGDTSRATTYIQSIENKYVNTGFPWPWYCAEAGWFLRLNSAYLVGAHAI